MEYKIKKGLIKAVKYLIIFLLPVLIDKFVYSMPEVANLTMGGILVLLLNWLKIRFGVRI